MCGSEDYRRHTFTSLRERGIVKGKKGTGQGEGRWKGRVATEHVSSINQKSRDATFIKDWEWL